MELAWAYAAAPDGETRFPALEGRPYERHVHRCRACGHFVSEHEMDLGGLYDAQYVDATYGESGQGESFERILALPPERSDNQGRVRRVAGYAARTLNLDDGRRPSALDVGSGLCVFLHRLRAEGWDCLALDPDPRAARHAREVAGVDAVVGDFMTADDLGAFDAITLNKVLEHVEDPVAMLARARRFLRPDGFVYVEVPDGASAATEGPGREEFFIEHLHAFSPASLAMMVDRAGLTPARIERLREPSGKHTLVAFCHADSAGHS
jgi:SAM-dependent methyltransferase